MNPRFSIVIPVLERGVYLAQAISSCLNQTVSDLEVVVSDDSSAEDLQAVVHSFRDERIKYHRNPLRLGASANHQEAASKAIGDYVLALNSDDILLPNCLEVAGRALSSCETAAAVYFSLTYLNGSRVSGYQPMPRTRYVDKEAFGSNPWLWKYHGTSPSCCLFKKQAFEQVGGYRTCLRLAYDWELFIRFATLGGGVVFLPEVLGVYRKHPEQMVQNHAIDGLWDMLDLWGFAEYRHWSTSEIASMVLSVCLAAHSGKDLKDVVAGVHRRRLGHRILVGIPLALWRRMLRRRDPAVVALERNSVKPANLDCALQMAAQALASASASPHMRDRRSSLPPRNPRA